MVHATSPSDDPRSGQLDSEKTGPRIVCCECGKGPVVRLSPPLCLNCDPERDRLDKEASILWREENPDASVFSVTTETKVKYVRRILYPHLTYRKTSEDA
jgi:hypothetical protein